MQMVLNNGVKPLEEQVMMRVILFNKPLMEDYIITGTTESFGNGGRDIYLIKTDANGIEQWAQSFWRNR